VGVHGHKALAYERQCAESNKIIAAHSLDEPGKNTDFDEGAGSLR
jgi:hypothetical protein